MEQNSSLIYEIRCVINEFLNFLNLTVSSMANHEEVQSNYSTDSETGSTVSEYESYSSSFSDTVLYNRFPVTEENPDDTHQSMKFLTGRDKFMIIRMRDTADMAQRLASGTDIESVQKIIEQYTQSVNNLTVILNMKCDQCRRQFYQSAKDTEELLHNLMEECSNKERWDNTDLMDKFRDNTMESFNILSYLEIKIRFYNGGSSFGWGTWLTNDNDSREKLKKVSTALKSFRETIANIARITSTIMEREPETEIHSFLKKRMADLGRSTTTMIIYTKSHLLYNLLMRKLNTIEKAANDLSNCGTILLAQRLQMIAKEACDLTLIFKKLVNDFDSKNESKTSGELLRASFSLDKSVKSFIFNTKKTQFLISSKNYYEKGEINIKYVGEFIEKAKLILTLFLEEINTILKAVK